MPELDWSDMPIHQAIKADWKTPEILIEGSLNCAKTTVWLDKEIDALLRWNGIKILLFRWLQDSVDTKLRPAFEELVDIRGLGKRFEWNSTLKRYECDNGSLAYMFGLKAVNMIEQYNKIRGLGASRVSGDQVEETPKQVGEELRGRLRPTLKESISGVFFPFQLTFVSNCEDEEFWLSKEFPLDNHIKGRKVYSLGLADNVRLPAESVESLWRTYPPEHPKHQTMVLGKRGPNITGDPVYEGLYRRDTHHRVVSYRPDATFYECFELGKHNPAWIFAQSIYAGGISFLGGVRGQEMMLEDFLRVVKEQRAKWLPFGADVKTCMSSMGSRTTMDVAGISWQETLRNAGFRNVQHRESSNSGDVVLALIEIISGLLRRRTPAGDEALAISNDQAHWLIASREGIRESPFLHIAFEAGYVWDKHYTSVANKELRQPREDDKFANIMHCVENLILNFFAGQPSDAERERKELERLKADAAGRYNGLGGGPNGWMAY